ncbi:MAG: diadenylate cyclase CdaA [Blautia sp.]|nr:diadenylate cyclase CdaA [Blautia sp.]MDY4516419.1 diadenylate cyclase CdaA [Lachnospiraceae bacterium]
MTLPTLSVRLTDIVEIAILSYLVYKVMLWIRETRAWTLLKGILMLGFFVLIAYVLQMDTIKFLVTKGADLALMAAVVIFQPELRRAMEQLGEKQVLANIMPFDTSKNVSERMSDKTINELVKASVEMGKAKTGALIVLEQNENLAEYERTGIAVDALLTSQLLINIFEHNTPLHDGAVLVRENRIVSATCYLPLSDNMVLSKELGTRHRAGVGVSEASDSLTIIVSEETGQISYAYRGELTRGVSGEELKKRLIVFQNKTVDAKKFRLWKGRAKNEEKDI